MSRQGCGFTSFLVLFSLVVASVPAAALQAATPSASDGGWIAYQTSEIRLMREDGSEDHPLTPEWTAGPQEHPDWSPDGSQIAFAVWDEDDTKDIWIANVDGTDATRIYDCADPCVWSDDPAFSPDGATLLFQIGEAFDGVGRGSIQAIDLSTGDISVIWETTIFTDYAFVPRWSPDGSQIVFELARFDSESIDAEIVVGSAIAMIDADGPVDSEPTLLTKLDSFSSYPDWGATNDTIVFMMAGDVGPDGPFDLYTITPDGTDLEQLTDYAGSGYQAIQPTWSPDNTAILFVYDQMWTNATYARLDVASGEVSITTTKATHPRQQP